MTKMSESRHLRLRHRKLMLKFKNDIVATQTAIVKFYERKLEDPVLDTETRTQLETRLDEAYEKLGAAVGD